MSTRPPDLPPVPAAGPPFVRPAPLALAFEGFGPEAFATLARLRAEPHVARYRQEKAALERVVVAPFRRYRDDLALNWVLPNGLPFETERGVFSRLLKNDFGAGGAHHHLWLSFYRPPRKRLTDLQLAHAVYPDGFRVGLYLGAYARGLFGPALRRTLDEPDEALAHLNALLGRGYVFAFAPRVTKPEGHPEFDAPLDRLPDRLARAEGIWVTRRFPRADVEAWGPALVARALDEVERLWPLYLFWAEAAGHGEQRGERT
jgi:hypothetical protein